MNWILYGFKGVGKTYFGSRLKLPFIDTDHLIEMKVKKTIRAFVLEEGPQAFRQVEREVITSLKVKGHVIALGGSSVFDQESLSHLRQLGHLIYLRGSKAILKQRILTPPLPTFIDPKSPESSFERIFCTRIPEYEKISSLIVDTENKSTSQILEELWQVINSEKFLKSQPGESLMAKPLES